MWVRKAREASARERVSATALWVGLEVSWRRERC